MILQDEEETQIQAVMYGSDITRYEKEFVPFQTYLVSVAYVRESTNAYGNLLHQFSWTIYQNTMVEPIEKVTPPKQPLSSPTQLKVASFDSLDSQPIGFDFDILAIVINGSPPSYASNGSRIQEFIIIDYLCHFEVTIQDETDSATATISDKIGEEQIHDIRCIKKQSLPLIPGQHKLLGKTLTIQLRSYTQKIKLHLQQG